jgi:nicotinate-nucleotide adenylyltransferase
VIGILGGTFDPIHFGHLRPAADVLKALALEEIRFVPTAYPPHRQPPAASGEHRLRMLELAVTSWPGFRVDAREMQMPAPSYTVRTLESMRAEFGRRTMCLLMGADAFLGLESWYQWERLFQLTHIVVMQRPGAAFAGLDGDLPHWARERLCRDSHELSQAASGLIIVQRVTPQDISASRIRAIIAHGQSVQALTPQAVWAYIRANGLYGYNDRGA